MTTSFLRPGGTGLIGLLAFWILGCAAPPVRPPDILEDQYRLSANHLFHYRPPLGWVEAPPPANASEIRLWLVSPDLSKSLQIREVRMDSAAAYLLREQGPSSMVQLIYRMEYEVADTGASPLVMTRDGGRSYWTFGGRDDTGMLYRVSMFVASGGLFECRSVGPEWESGSEIHKEFLAGLRW